MAESTTYKTPALCGVLLLYWVSSTSLSSAAFGETLAYRENSHNEVLASENGSLADNPYQARRMEIRARQALPSPDLLKEPPPSVASIEPVKDPTPGPMKITIPNLKAMEKSKLPSPALLANSDSGQQPRAVPQQKIISNEPAKAVELVQPPIKIAEVKPLITGDEQKQRIAEFKPIQLPPKPIATASAEQLAALAPSAGPSETAPLIASPDENISLSSKSVPPSAPPPQDDNYENPVATKALDEALETSEYSEAPSELPPLEPKAMPVKNKIAAAKKKDPLNIIKPYSPLDSEPKMNLSTASKAMVSKIPSNLDKPKPKPQGPFNIERTKDMKEIFKADEAPANETVKHEAMGIKIEVKSRQANLDYELEKAYDALVSGQPTMAMEIYKNILSNDPNNKGALFGLATSFHRSGQLDQARIYYSKLLTIDPDNRDGLNNFLVLLADEAPEEALSQMDALSKRNPNFSPIPAQMAVIYQKLGNVDKASEYMYKAINLAPENMVYRYNLAIMLDRQKKYDEAGRLYKQLIESAMRGETIPGNLQKIQQRLTFISSNRH